jgi:large subunit ribosomal protein L4
MAKIDVLSTKGIKKGALNLPKEFGGEINKKLLAQALRVYEDRGHPGFAKTKSRGEVDISTRKIYKQKGTGLARHGARSAPIFVGGGIAHGPKGVKRILTLPKKMRRRALISAFNWKVKEDKLFVIDGLSALKKTKDAVGLVGKITLKADGKKKNPRLLFVLSDDNKISKLSFKNIENSDITTLSGLNAYNIFFSDFVIVDKKVFGGPDKIPDAIVKSQKKIQIKKVKPAKKSK